MITRKRFSDFVESKDKALGDNDYQGDLAFPRENPDYRLGEKPLPYKSEEDDDEANGKVLVADDSASPLGDEETKGMGKASALGKPIKSHTKTVKKAKKLTNEEFIKTEIFDRLKTENKTLRDIHGKKYTPEFNTTLNYLIESIIESPRLLDRFVIELKKRNAISPILESFLEHGDTYKCLVENFSGKSGKSYANRLAKSLHDNLLESVDAPVEKRFNTPQSSEPETPSGGDGKKPGGPFGGGGMQPPQGKPPGGPFGGGGMQPPQGKPSGGPFGGGGMQPKAAAGGEMPMKMKAESAAENIFNATATYKPLLNLQRL